MILRFQFSNFKAFRGEHELSLIAARLAESVAPARTVPGSTEKILPVAALFGANASGKTTVLRAVQFLVHAVRNSHRAWDPSGGVPVPAFKGIDDENALGKASTITEFLMDFVNRGSRYQFGFRCSEMEIFEEWLLAYPNGRKQTWYSRKGSAGISFSRNFIGDNKTIAKLTRKNSLFISAAAQNNHEVLGPIYEWFTRSIAFEIGQRKVHESQTARFCAEEEGRLVLANLLSLADLGIVDVRTREEKVDPAVAERTKRVLDAISSIFEWKPAFPIQQEETEASVQLMHRVGSSIVPFDLEDESDGTKAYLSLLAPILRALGSGSVLLIDELGMSLHSLLASKIVQLFNDRRTNPRGAQLIFNTHDTNLLDPSILRRDQVWFTEKDAVGHTHLYPLTDFKVRRDENLENGYLQGRYGAIPFVNIERFAETQEPIHDVNG